MILKFYQILGLSSMWCLGIFGLFYPGMILGDVGDYLAVNISKWVFKPTIGCMPCMASVWGLIIYMNVMYGELGSLFLIPFIICLSGLNFFIVQMFGLKRPEL